MPKKTAHLNKSKWSRPKGGWSTTGYSGKGKNTKVKLALLILGLIILVILIGKLLGFITSFQKPIYSDSAVYRNYIWDQKSKINFVVKSDEIYLLSFDPIDKKIIVLKLPDNLYLNLPNGLGTWKLSSVYDLGQSGKERNGGKLLKQSISNFLGVPVEGYIAFQNDLQEKPVKQLIDEIRDGFWNSFSMVSDINTDFTPSELLGLNSGIRSIRFDKVVIQDLEEAQVLDKDTLPDGTTVFVSDSVRVDSIASKFFNISISTEKIPVAIFNSTNHPGLAQKAARLVSNLGGNVIISTNGNSNKDKTVVFVKDIEQKDALTPQVLGQIFASDCSDGLKCDIIICDLANNATSEFCKTDSQILESRAQINVVLGEDFQSRF